MMEFSEQSLTAALGYAERGWRVMPLYSITPDGVCSCYKGAACTSPGKHPRTMDGLKSASSDPSQIENWWSMWPESNVGVLTGAESGIIVLDVDDTSTKALDGRELLPTLTQETGSGGVHYIYRHPGGRLKSSVKVLPGIDSRADGGYIVAPPSRHVSGQAYRWTVERDIELAPQWWVKLLTQERVRTAVPGEGERVFEGGRNQALASLAGTIRKLGAGYPTILATLQAYNQEACEPPLEDHEVTNVARSISGYEIETAEEKELRTQGSAIRARILNTQKKALEHTLALETTPGEKAGPPPENIIPEGGLIYEIADYILSQSIYPQPLLAVAASTAFVGALAGRKWQTETGLRSNVYFVGLAQSGSGKDAARKAIKRIMATVPDLEKVMGGDRIASGAGLISALEEWPVKLFLLDEFGLLLQGMTGKSEAYRKEIVTNLMQLYSDAGSVFSGTEYADKKARARVTIYDPCVVLYATSTQETFWRALSSQEAVSGAVARLMAIDIGQGRPARKTPTIEKPPEAMLRKIATMSAYRPGGNISEVGSINGSNPDIVHMTPEVKDAWDALDESVKGNMNSEAAASIYSRVAEHTAKLALIHAVARDHEHPLIEETSFAWARSIALWSANLMMEQLSERMADNETERTSKAIENEIRSGGPKGKTKAELGTVLAKVRPYEQKAYLESLQEAGKVAVGNRPTGGRPAIAFIHRDHYKAAKESGFIGD